VEPQSRQADVDAYIGLGANIRDPQDQIRVALNELSALPATTLVRASSLYRSAPWGYADQPDFINAVACLRTGLTPPTLLVELLRIEQRHGRERSFRNAPRPLDLDIIVYGDSIIDQEGLTIPHPRMRERAFVLVPLQEISPDLIIPGMGALRQLVNECRDAPPEKIKSNPRQ
jgi:2-amino-4-hydroxy-6-hydroxymethyldihydropteridine diphosphokinase